MSTLNGIIAPSSRFSSGPGSITAIGYFGIKDAAGLVRESGTVSVPLTGAAKTAFI